MNYPTLRKALEIKSGTVRISNDSIPNIAGILKSCYAGQPIVFSEAEPGTGDDTNETVVIKGKSSFLNRTGLTAIATLKLDKDGKVLMSLKYALPVEPGNGTRWKFSDSFPNLPKVIDWRNGTYGNALRPPLDDLEFDEASFVVFNQEPPENDGVKLKSGINFLGKMRVPSKDSTPLPGQDQPNLIGSVMKRAFGYDRQHLTVFGTVVLEGNGAQALEPRQYPWSANGPPVPGILLQANLGLPLPLGKSHGSGLTFDHVWFRIYSPTSQEWLSSNVTYEPVMAYTGALGGLNFAVKCEPQCYCDPGSR